MSDIEASDSDQRDVRPKVSPSMKRSEREDRSMEKHEGVDILHEADLAAETSVPEVFFKDHPPKRAKRPPTFDYDLDKLRPPPSYAEWKQQHTTSGSDTDVQEDEEEEEYTDSDVATARAVTPDLSERFMGAVIQEHQEGSAKSNFVQISQDSQDKATSPLPPIETLSPIYRSEESTHTEMKGDGFSSGGRAGDFPRSKHYEMPERGAPSSQGIYRRGEGEVKERGSSQSVNHDGEESYEG